MTHQNPDLSSASDWSYSVPREKFASANQKHYSELVGDASTLWNFCFRGKPTEGWQREMGLFSQATLYFTILGSVVRRPIGATLELNSNPGFFFSSSNAFSRIFFSNSL